MTETKNVLSSDMFFSDLVTTYGVRKSEVRCTVATTPLRARPVPSSCSDFLFCRRKAHPFTSSSPVECLTHTVFPVLFLDPDLMG